MSKLPFEILNIVHSHLDKEDVFQCVLACKSWKKSAMSFFYKDLSIKICGASPIKKQLHLDPIERDRYFQHGTSTKELVVCSDKAENNFRGIFSSEDTDNEYTKEEWLMLLRYLPNILVLNLVDSGNSDKYLQYILDSDDFDKILPRIMKITPVGRESLSGPSIEPSETYYAVCYKFRKTITKLNVGYETREFKMGSIKGRMLTLLNEFTSLTHLVFNNECDEQLTTFDIMDACPHLVSLSYYSEYNIPDSVVEKILDDDLSPKRLNNSIKELKLSVPTIPEHYVTYLKQYLASYMDVIKLDIHDIDVFDWVERFGLDNAVDFLRSLSKVKTATIKWTPDMHYDRQTTSTESELTIMYTLLNAMRRNEEVYCEVHYDDFQSVDKSIKLAPDGSLYIDYGLKQSDYYHTTTIAEGESDEQPRSVIQFVMPNRLISKIGPEVIHNMAFIVGDTTPDLPLEFLRYALNNCPHLQQFYYSSMYRPSRGIFIGIDFEKQYDLVAERNDLSRTIQENIKVVKLRNMMPSNELLDLMRMYMPATEAFICKLDCSGYSPNEPFEADLTAFEQLNFVLLSARLLCGKNQNTAFMEIQFVDKDWEYYCLEIDDLTVTKTTLKQMNEQISSRGNEDIRKAVIKCHKRVKIALSSDFSLITIISNGEISVSDRYY
ncbi:uncharacterized protein EV154DRAFT_599526 [Mucor mucedo]|uniref:uncharacterized protein n=1 Tax=Mucor mucedo TaxID=29922 RepID=UPI002220D3E7|nr:uncharacterized protein EV154DRAFT_599526 [Mucor mucedo]KAI7895002.1 hypothetical protein EV154DRAFT_599526 [Mucor mucedo]